MDETYANMVNDGTIYTLKCRTPWVAWSDPGPYHVIDLYNNMLGKADKLIQYNFKKKL